MATAVNAANQQYFTRIAPDFSVLELAERYFYDRDPGTEYFGPGGIMSYRQAPIAGNSYQSSFRRAIFKVYTEGDVTIPGLPTDEYCVIPHRLGIQIVVAISESPISISSSSAIDLVVGVAF